MEGATSTVVATGMDAITSGVTTMVGLVPQVFSMITGNPLLAAFAACGLIGAAIGVFRKVKKSSH